MDARRGNPLLNQSLPSCFVEERRPKPQQALSCTASVFVYPALRSRTDGIFCSPRSASSTPFQDTSLRVFSRTSNHPTVSRKGTRDTLIVDWWETPGNACHRSNTCVFR